MGKCGYNKIINNLHNKKYTFFIDKITDFVMYKREK